MLLSSVASWCVLLIGNHSFPIIFSFICIFQNLLFRVVFHSLGMIVTSALIIWKALMCFTGSESPVVVVLSGSMEPGFKRVRL